MTNKYRDFLDELGITHESLNQFRKLRLAKVAKLKKNGKWPKLGYIYWDDLNEELHLVTALMPTMVQTYWGHDIIGGTMQLEIPDDWILIGKL